ncbi:hypothetical protein QYF36_012062 [Acer negundo]|nr:hypothetical protein QYF36_012062 [Acer negundo]
MFEKSQPQAMGFAQSVLTDAYLYLIENPDKRRAFFGCPLEGRKDLLESMIFPTFMTDISITILTEAASELDGLICKAGTAVGSSFPTFFMTVFVLLLL